MFANNPFADLATVISPGLIQAYVVLMFILVVGGTIIDMIHKKSATYFFDKAEKAKASRERELGGGEKNAILIKTIAHDVLTSGEFCSQKRRVSHLFTMYGFVTFIATTIIMVFGFPTSDTPAPTILPLLWHLGALMVCFGGYWFWFFIRVDVAAEGHSPFRVMRADLFILSLLERDACVDLVRPAGEWLRGCKGIFRPVHHRYDISVRIRTVVKVCTYVLQARRRAAETGVGGGWFEEQVARPGRQTGNLR